MKRYLSAFLGGALGLVALMPLSARAAIDCTNVSEIKDIESFLCVFGNLIGLATGILAALALLVFFWGLVKYLAKADDEKAKEQGKNTMVWGVVALFVMFSVFGLVRFLMTSFGISTFNNRPLNPPKVIFP